MPCIPGSPTATLRQQLLVDEQPDVWWPMFLQACQELGVPPEQLLGDKLASFVVRSERLTPSFATRMTAWNGLHDRLHELRVPDTFARALIANSATGSTRLAIGSAENPTVSGSLSWAQGLRQQYDQVRR